MLLYKTDNSIMKQFVSFILVLIIAVTSIAQSKSSKREVQVLAKMSALSTALVNKDSILLNTLLADDVTYGHSNGWMQTKNELIRSIISGEQDYKKINTKNSSVRFYSNTAVVNTRTDFSLIMDKKQLDLDLNLLLLQIASLKVCLFLYLGRQLFLKTCHRI